MITNSGNLFSGSSQSVTKLVFSIEEAVQREITLMKKGTV